MAEAELRRLLLWLTRVPPLAFSSLAHFFLCSDHLLVRCRCICACRCVIHAGDGVRVGVLQSVEACVKSFDAVCQDFDCTCSASDDAW